MSITLDGSLGITSPSETVPNTFSSSSNFGFKSRIINGAMVIDQRNAGASVTPTSQQFSVDRYSCGLTQASKYTAQQNAGAITPPTGFSNYLGITSNSAYSVLAGDAFYINQSIEGYNVADLGFGTANASSFTLSFKVYSSLTGTFGVVFKNSANTRSYPATYSIPVANTWTTISITIAGDTTGTWLTTNASGLKCTFGLGSGATYSGTAGSWSANDYYSATGATSVVGTSGATFYITGVQLEKGSTATSFDYRPYGTELSLCQRYYIGSQVYNGVKTASGYTRINVPLSATMRTTPALVYSDSVGNVSKISTYASNDTRTNNRTPIVVVGSSPSMIQIFPNNTDADTGYEVFISCSSEL